MREVKFRVVNKKTNEIVGYEWLEDEGWKHSLPEKGIISHGVFYGPRVNKRFIRVQFIGLKDKKGKEIYESDIFRANGGDVASVLWDNENARFIYKGCETLLISSVNKTGEVIGNIYENRELLT